MVRIDVLVSDSYTSRMSTKQITISEFCAHTAEALQIVELDGALVEVVRDGTPVAYLSPAPQAVGDTGTLGTWIGTGIGTVLFAPGMDPDDPAFAPEEWEEFPEETGL